MHYRAPYYHLSRAPPSWAANPVPCNRQCNLKHSSSKQDLVQSVLYQLDPRGWGKYYISEGKCHKARGAPPLLTLIMALEVILKSVARSLTCLIFSLLSAGSFRDSSSLRERCKAVPCLAIKSLHVLRSSTLLESVRRVF